MDRDRQRHPRRSRADGTPSLVRLATVVLGALLLGAAAASSSPLYAAIYPTPAPGDPPPPGPNSNILTSEQLLAQLEDALGEAAVSWRTEPATVIEYVPTRLVATLVFGTDLDALPGRPPRVEIAWENEAELTAVDPEAVHVEPQQPVRKALGDATERADGGYERVWDWTITATERPAADLLLVFKPVIFVDGQRSEGLKERNEPIEISVQVHPAETAFDAAVAAARTRLEVTAPDRMTDGATRTVTARLPRAWDPQAGVVVQLALTRRDDSVRARIDAQQPTDGGLTRSWAVRPTEDGDLGLQVVVDVTAEAGDRDPLHEPVTHAVDIVVEKTLWDRLLQPVVYLTTLLGLVGVVLGLRSHLRKQRETATAGAGKPPVKEQPAPPPDEPQE